MIKAPVYLHRLLNTTLPGKNSACSILAACHSQHNQNYFFTLAAGSSCLGFSLSVVTPLDPRSIDRLLNTFSAKSTALRYLGGNSAEKAARTKTIAAMPNASPVITFISP